MKRYLIRAIGIKDSQLVHFCVYLRLLNGIYLNLFFIITIIISLLLF